MASRKDLKHLQKAMSKLKNPLKKMEAPAMHSPNHNPYGGSDDPYVVPSINEFAAESTGMKPINMPETLDVDATEKMSKMGSLISDQKKKELQEKNDQLTIDSHVSRIYTQGGSLKKGWDDLSTKEKKAALINRDDKYLHYSTQHLNK